MIADSESYHYFAWGRSSCRTEIHTKPWIVPELPNPQPLLFRSEWVQATTCTRFQQRTKGRCSFPGISSITNACSPGGQSTSAFSSRHGGCRCSFCSRGGQGSRSICFSVRAPLSIVIVPMWERANQGRADYFEVALLFGSCFLVNYVTIDGTTNFAEVRLADSTRFALAAHLAVAICLSRA